MVDKLNYILQDSYITGIVNNYKQNYWNYDNNSVFLYYILIVKLQSILCEHYTEC